MILYFLWKTVGKYIYRTFFQTQDSDSNSKKQTYNRPGQEERTRFNKSNKSTNDPNKKGFSEFKGGEYVDYEEVD